MRQLLKMQNAKILLHNAATFFCLFQIILFITNASVITKCHNSYYKLRRLLQSYHYFTLSTSSWDITDEVRSIYNNHIQAL